MTSEQNTSNGRPDRVLSVYRGLLSSAGNRLLTRALVFTGLSGVTEGAAMVVLLPLSQTLTGGSRWGLSTAGWLLVLAILAVIGAVMRYLSANTAYECAGDFVESAQLRLGDRLAELPLGWFRGTTAGRVSNLVSEGFVLAGQLLGHSFTAYVSNTAAAAVMVLGCWAWDWRLGLTLTIGAPVAAAAFAVSKRLKRAGDLQVAPAQAEYSARIVEFAACQPALRAAGRSQQFEPLEQAAAADGRARLRELWLSTAGVLINGMFVQAIVVALIVMTALLAAAQTLAPLAVIAFIGLTLRFAQNIQAIAELTVATEAARAPLAEAQHIMTARRLPQAAARAELPAPGSVDFTDVHFAYEAGQSVFTGVSFRAEPNTVTAIVGPSGSGKTTVTALISRFWDVDAGVIEVGGADVRAQLTEQLMSQLSLVFQNVYLFDDTLEASVRIGRPDAQPAEVRRAADLAGVSSIAERLPAGWATRVGEGGRLLSGGERQRVSLARALLKRAPIVLFDEATSALDAENERNVLASMRELSASATLVVIAHRLETVRDADHIIVLDGRGGIAEAGTHAQLYAAGGPYRRFWDSRAAAAGWTLMADEPAAGERA